MYKLDVVTPKGIIFTGDVYQTVITTADGEIGILENHMLLLTNIKPGKLRIEKSPTDVQEFAVTYGVIDVAGDKVIALVEEVYDLDSINVEEEKALLEEANQKLSSESITDQEREHYQKQKERAEALINLAKSKSS
ncbi:MAG: ATP synthase F1 subunit epsilon [Hydrogenothermaceae bacterium]|nr:ATP synthase F1 subunit epsilon [Hydrogenothermaceae bacterium]